MVVSHPVIQLGKRTKAIHFTYDSKSSAQLIRRVLRFLNEDLFLDMEKEDMLCHLS